MTHSLQKAIPHVGIAVSRLGYLSARFLPLMLGVMTGVLQGKDLDETILALTPNIIAQSPRAQAFLNAKLRVGTAVGILF